ncbi:MAG: hypothetical protein AAF600_15280 [Bacteroidota bacterium]
MFLWLQGGKEVSFSSNKTRGSLRQVPSKRKISNISDHLLGRQNLMDDFLMHLIYPSIEKRSQQLHKHPVDEEVAAYF